MPFSSRCGGPKAPALESFPKDGEEDAQAKPGNELVKNAPSVGKGDKLGHMPTKSNSGMPALFENCENEPNGAREVK